MLRFTRVGLRVVTAKRRFTADVYMKAGVNILQAGNTSGKSTSLQAIIYGLGLEKMWGPRVGVPLAHAMQERIQQVKLGPYENVLQSWVELDIENDRSEVLKLRRDVTGGNDQSLISTSRQDLTRDFYINLPGAATREDGFHNYLCRFMGVDLPQVMRFNGTEGPLYLEAIFPMLFIEQKRGWSSVQGPFPTHLQIQDIARRVMEFLLALDIGTIRRELAEIRLRLRHIRERWIDRAGDLRQKLVSGSRFILPAAPTADFALSPSIGIEVLVGERWRLIDDALHEVKKQIAELAAVEIPVAGDAAERNIARLHTVSEEIDRIGNVLETERVELTALRQEQNAVARRIEALQEDLVRHKDAERLKSLGSVLGPVVADNSCPTCHQSMTAELLAQPTATVMALEENIAFLNSNLKLYQSNEAGVARAVADSRARQSGIEADIGRLRAEARSLKEALVQATGAPSRAHITEIVRLEAWRDALVNTREQADGVLDELTEMAKSYSELLERQRVLERQTQSADDKKKLTALLSEFRSRLERYEFSSLAGNEVILAEDNLRPVMEQRDGEDVIIREIGLSLSASDAVRLKWAYELALLSVARKYKTNHPGFVVIDEPGQHQMEWSSMKAFLRSLAEDADPRQQIIVATSLTRAAISEAMSDMNVNVLPFEGLILQPAGETPHAS